MPAPIYQNVMTKGNLNSHKIKSTIIQCIFSLSLCALASLRAPFKATRFNKYSLDNRKLLGEREQR